MTQPDPPSDAREVMSWDDLGLGCRELADAMHADDWITFPWSALPPVTGGEAE